MEFCRNCKEPFYVTEHHLAMPGTKEREPISCPYCGHTIYRITNGWWNVSAIEQSERLRIKLEQDGN